MIRWRRGSPTDLWSWWTPAAYAFWDGRLYLLLVPNEGVVLRRMVSDEQDWVVTADNPVWRPRVYQAAWQVLGEALVGVHFLA